MKDKIPVTSRCGKCGNTFTTQTHKEYPDKNTPDSKKIHVYYDGPDYSVSCANCGYFTLFSRHMRNAPSQT